MPLKMINRKKEEELWPETNDLLIVFDDDKKTSEIHRISEIKEDRVFVRGYYNIPIEDCEITNSFEGRHFFYRAPSQSIKETARLAKLEQSIVLQQVTNYKPVNNNRPDMNKIMLFIALLVLIITFGAVSCQHAKAETISPIEQTIEN